MPLPTEELWQAVTKKEYAAVKSMIEKFPDLVNSINDNGRTLLTRLVLMLNPPLDLIKFIATQPNLCFNNPHSNASQTTIGAILSTARPELLEIFTNNPLIIWDDKKLTYLTAKDNLEFNAGKPKAENYKKMLQIIRDVSIRYAIAKDDPTILEQLKIAGDNLSNPLSDGILPVRLITNENQAPKVKEWFLAQIGKNEGQIMANMDSFLSHKQEIQKTQEKIDTLQDEKALNDFSFFKKAIDSKVKRVEDILMSKSS